MARKTGFWSMLLVVPVVSIGVFAAGGTRGIGGNDHKPVESGNSPVRTSPSKLQPNHANHPKPVIDGALNPELISDAMAYGVLLRMLSHEDTPQSVRMARAYCRKVLGTPNKQTDDVERLLATSKPYIQRVRAVDAERLARHNRGDLQDSDMVERRDRVVDDFQTALKESDRFKDIDAFVQTHIKSGVRIFY